MKRNLVRISAVSAAIAILYGCGGGRGELDSTNISSYPLLEKHLGLTQEDIDMLKISTPHLTAVSQDESNFLNSENIKRLQIGSTIHRVNSTFVDRPIFNLKGLQEENYLSIDFVSTSTEESTISMSSKSEGQSVSTQDMKSGNFSAAGPYGINASYAHSSNNKKQTMDNTGSASINFRKELFSSTPSIKILAGNLNENADFTRFLIGSKIADADLKVLVKPLYCEKTTIPAQSEQLVCGFEVPALNHLDENNVYGRVQILSSSQDLFYLVRAQYVSSSSSDPRREKVLNALLGLRKNIAERIEYLTANYGHAFVSALYTGADATASGALKFSNGQGSDETRTADAFSLGFKTAFAAAQGGAAFESLKGTGYSNAFKDISVKAESRPAGFVLTESWVKDIKTMLESLVTPLSVPVAAFKDTQSVILPEKSEVKAKIMPPIGSFNDYAQFNEALKKLNPTWKESVKDEWTAIKQNLGVGEAAAARVREGGDRANYDDWMPDDLVFVNPNRAGNGQLSEGIMKELERLKSIQSINKPRPILRADANVMRISGQYVRNFEVTPLAKVLPQFRPDLSVPGEVELTPELYPNITGLRISIERIGDALGYLKFLSSFPSISNVTPSMVDGFSKFKDEYLRGAMAKNAALSNSGSDLSNEAYLAFNLAMFGPANALSGADVMASALYKQSGQNIDIYNYIRNVIFNPEHYAFWLNNPGGFVPFSFNKSNETTGMSFVHLKGLQYDALGNAKTDFGFSSPYNNPAVDLFSFYSNKGVALQTPWYPIFRFNGNKPASFLYSQFVGSTIVVYGRKYVIVPDGSNSQTSVGKYLDLAKTNPDQATPIMGPEIIKRLNDPENSFTNRCDIYPEQNVGGFKNFSLYFPDSTFDMSLYLKRRMVLSFTGDFCVKNKPEPIADGVYRALAWDTAYQAFERNTGKETFVGKDGKRSRPERAWHNLCEPYGNYAGDKLCSTHTRLFALAPINSTSAGTNYSKALSWGVSRLGIDQYGADDYNDLSIARYTSRAASSNALTGKTSVLPK
jgi:hypothetical protein